MSRALEGHTTQRYDGELNSLHMRVLEMGGLVLSQVKRTLSALRSKDIAMAREVLEREHDVDHLETQIDNEVVTVIAKRAPVARDLRVIMAIAKTVTDLERIGDEAARLANLAIAVYEYEEAQPSAHLMRDVQTMGQIALDTLQQALSSFDTLDAESARRLVCSEDELDIEFQSSLRRLATFLWEDARNVGHTIHNVLMIKAVERIGEHARNLAEYVIYMVWGEDVRHYIGAYCETGTGRGSRAAGDE